MEGSFESSQSMGCRRLSGQNWSLRSGGAMEWTGVQWNGMGTLCIYACTVCITYGIE